MANRRKRRTRSDWVRICSAYESIGMTARVLAEANDVNNRTLLWWRSKLRTSTDAVIQYTTSERFVEVVEASKTSRELTVIVRCGDAVIECEGLPPASWLREVAGAC